MKLRNVSASLPKTSSPALISSLVVLLGLGTSCAPLTDELSVVAHPRGC